MDSVKTGIDGMNLTFPANSIYGEGWTFKPQFIAQLFPDLFDHL